MKRIYLSAIFSAALIFTGCKNENTTPEERVDENTDLTQENVEEVEEEVLELKVQMEPKSGSDLTGTVTFTQENEEVTMTAEFTGLKEGMHAIHLHEKADCSAEDGTSAGGHWNPTFEDHGEWGSQKGYHRGDIGNFDVNAEGKGSITFTTDQWCIGCDDDKKNIIGKAVIVHDGVDDFTSQPSGAAGTRIGCGVIKDVE
ncbi:superoxide dismutase family protein [Salinimicrobium gaetbulicola]|uniref:Superoxide dismutase family protein n=1 Tax=Salinimicrobium gaetbulicola TaxID=999702 RepID=A0ABW3IAW7_9FLAO